MNILILGGSGYLGSKMAHHLLRLYNQSIHITCTKRIKSKSSRLDDISDQIQIIPTSVDAIAAALQYQQFDVVLNMVCNYGRSKILYDSVLDANIELPLSVLNLVTEYGVQNYITIGTGLPDELNMYTFSKKVLGDFGRFYAEKQGINFVDIQLEMFYSSDEPLDRFIPSTICKMIKGENVDTTIGTQKRDIIAVSDVLYAITEIMKKIPKGYTSIGVGTGVAPSISEIVDYIWHMTGEKSEVHKGAVPLRENEPSCVADTDQISRICDWHPIAWQDGLTDMIDEIRERLKKEEV